MNCNGCAHEFADTLDFDFCPYCGHDLKEAKATAAAKARQEEKNYPYTEMFDAPQKKNLIEYPKTSITTLCNILSTVKNIELLGYIDDGYFMQRNIESKNATTLQTLYNRGIVDRIGQEISLLRIRHNRFIEVKAYFYKFNKIGWDNFRINAAAEFEKQIEDEEYKIQEIKEKLATFKELYEALM